MDLNNLKNLDIKDLIEKLKSLDLTRDKKALTKFGIGFGAVFIFLFFYYVFIAPVINEQKVKINLMKENEQKIEEYNNNIAALTQDVKALEPEFEKNSKLFHSQKEVEDLYQNISNFALANGLSIININKGSPQGVGGQQNSTDASSGQGTEGQNFIYFKIPVQYEIKGNFLGYLKFRRALASSAKVINFDKEEINVEKEAQGHIVSKGTISIVGLPDEYK